MTAYGSFAQVYDLFMDNVPYEEWSEYIISLLKENGISEGLVLDLGCGTGKMTRLLSRAGYDMIGIDNSADMLEIAQEYQYSGKVSGSEEEEPLMERRTSENDLFLDTERDLDEGSDFEKRILYLLQDMREFELYGTVRAVVSICDSMNYLLEEEELLETFRLVNNYLDPKGVFIFDMNTHYKYAKLLGEQTIAENREEGSFIWENYFDEEQGINEYELTLFIQEENGLYRKYEEIHYQRVYEMEIVKRLLEEAGMEFIAAYDAFTHEPVRTDSERMYIIAREHGKEPV
uniref:class I SAM-dependent DNA methyltransferase n=1 Tax=Agathobacter sp. TaxID=2021311 RepID=UPI00405668F2